MIYWDGYHPKREIFSGLLLAGNGRYVAGVLDASYVDDNAYAVDNMLAYFAFKQAGRILNPTLYGVASSLKNSLMNILYNSSTGMFYAAYNSGSFNTSENLELLFMAAYFFIEENDLDSALDMIDAIEADYICVDVTNSVEGYKATITDSKIWYEGSYAVAMIYFKLGDLDKYKLIITSLNKLLNDDGSFRSGIIKDGVIISFGL